MKIEYKNIYFDPDITPFHQLAKDMAKSFGYTADLAVNKELSQLIRLRIAQFNSCSYCIILHAKTAREIGIEEAKIDNISSWWNSELYTVKEKAALAYCDALSIGNTDNFETYHHKMISFFSEQEIAEIAAIIINMNVWTRLKLAQGQIPIYIDHETSE